jgi:C1A family cysteine protease
MEQHHTRQTGTEATFSTEFIYGLRDVGYFMSDGMMIRNALSTIRKYGDPYEQDCPGNNNVEEANENVNANFNAYVEKAYPHRVTAYYRCRNADEIKTALMKHGPVAISMNTYRNASLVDDVYTWDAAAGYGKHCVLIIGWDERGWLIQNSWGDTYGGDGRFILPFNYNINEAWGVIDEVQDDTDLAKPNEFIKLISWLYNKLVNFIWKKFQKKS